MEVATPVAFHACAGRDTGARAMVADLHWPPGLTLSCALLAWKL